MRLLLGQVYVIRGTCRQGEPLRLALGMEGRVAGTAGSIEGCQWPQHLASRAAGTRVSAANRSERGVGSSSDSPEENAVGQDPPCLYARETLSTEPGHTPFGFRPTALCSDQWALLDVLGCLLRRDGKLSPIYLLSVYLSIRPPETYLLAETNDK